MIKYLKYFISNFKKVLLIIAYYVLGIMKILVENARFCAFQSNWFKWHHMYTKV